MYGIQGRESISVIDFEGFTGIGCIKAFGYSE